MKAVSPGQIQCAPQSDVTRREPGCFTGESTRSSDASGVSPGRSRRSTACSLVRKGRPRPPRPLPGILSMQVRGVTCSECRWASLFGRGMLILGRGLESKALAVKMDHFNEVPWDLPRSAFPGTPTCVLVSREGISVLTAPLTLACLLCGDGVAPRDREGRKLLYLLLLPDSFHHV